MFVNLSSPIPKNFLLEIERLEKQKKKEIEIIKINKMSKNIRWKCLLVLYKESTRDL